MTDPRVRDVLASLAIQSNGYGRGVCPVCTERKGSPDRKGSLWFHAEKRFFGCWRCGLKGRLDDDGPRLAPPPVAEPPPVPTLPDEAVALASADGRTARALKPARDYLTGTRGLSWEVVEATGAHACLGGFYGGRVVFPVHRRGDVRGFVARAWAPCDRPYLYPRGFDRSAMWNGDALDSGATGPVWVVEGVFDAARLWPDAVALLGKPSAVQIDILARSPRPVVVALDADAWREGRALALKLRGRGAAASWVRLPPGSDPDTLGKRWFVDRL